MRTGVIGAAGLILPSIALPFATQLSPSTSLTAAVTILSVGFFFAAFPMPPSTAAATMLVP